MARRNVSPSSYSQIPKLAIGGGGGEGGEGGALYAYMGVSPCRMSILRHGNVACRPTCRFFLPMYPVEFKKWPCLLSLSYTYLLRAPVACR